MINIYIMDMLITVFFISLSFINWVFLKGHREIYKKLETRVIQSNHRHISTLLFTLLFSFLYFSKDLFFPPKHWAKINLKQKNNSKRGIERDWEETIWWFCGNPVMNGITSSPTSPLCTREIAVMAAVMLLCISA